MSLTGAELRLLPYLATHLTFPEIGDRLFISRNTAKTEAVSVYRKLGVSSRSEAIARPSRSACWTARSIRRVRISSSGDDAPTGVEPV